MKIIPVARKMRVVARRGEAGHRDWRLTRWITLLAVFALTVLTTAPSVWVRPLPTAEGTEIQRPIYASRTFGYEPEDAEVRWRERRDEEFIRVFAYDPSVREGRIARVQAALAAARDAAVRRMAPAAARDLIAATEPDIAAWTDEQVAALAGLASEETFRETIPRILQAIYLNRWIVGVNDKARFETNAMRRRVVEAGGTTSLPDERPMLVHPDETDFDLRNLIRQHAGPIILDHASATGAGNVDADPLDTLHGVVALRLLRLGIAPTLTYDKEASDLERENFARQPPVRIARGTLLAPRGYPAERLDRASSIWPHSVTHEESRLLEAYAAELQRAAALKFVAQMLFVCIAFLIVSFFVIKFRRELGFTSNTVLLLALPVLLALMLGRLFLLLAGEGASYAGYAFPAGVIGILGVLLLDVRLATLLVTWGCLLFGLEANLEYEFVIVGLFGGYAAVAALYNFRERREVLYAGLLIGLVNAATITILHFIGQTDRDPLVAASIGALSGIMCSLISFAVLPVFEVAFRITTDMRLLELSGIQHPLLKKMEEVAPGTLQHTLNVAKLAESAATAIGVNYLLVRAGCYFHDIGKMAKPEYFTENQLTAEDKKRHNELKPQMSTLIIKNHVKEGLELARRHNLPPVVTAFIAEHHGTTLIEYFHRKAQRQYEEGILKEPVREEDYRYAGPRPQTIESALVMLADTVEATATAKLSGMTVREEDIRQIVRNAIAVKFGDNQFDDCNLTMRDLNLIRESFIKTLRSRFHARIDYPGARKDDHTPPPQQRPRRPKTHGEDSAPITQIEGDEDAQSRQRQIATTG